MSEELEPKQELQCPNCLENLSNESAFRTTEHGIACVNCTIQCENCSKNILSEEVRIAERESLCEECFDENYSTCDNCSQLVERGNALYNIRFTARYVRDGEVESGCEECCAICYNCDRLFNKESMRLDDSYYFCEGCFWEHHVSCEECGDIVSIEESIHSDGGTIYCNSCYTNSYIGCEGCGDEIERDGAHHGTDGFYCDDCFNDLDIDGSITTDKPDFEFSYTKEDKFLQILLKLLPISIRDLENKHPRLANGLAKLIEMAGGRRTNNIITAEKVEAYRSSLDPQTLPIRYNKWDRSLQRSFIKAEPQLVLDLSINDNIINKLRTGLQVVDEEGNTIFFKEKLFLLINRNSIAETHPVYMDSIGWARIETNEEEKYILVDEIQSDHLGKSHQIMNKSLEASLNSGINNIRNMFNIKIENRFDAAEKQRRNDIFLKEVKEYQEIFSDFPAMIIQAIIKYAKDNNYKKLFWHTYEGGKKLKSNNPPIELYSKIPKEHSFVKTPNKPFNLEADFFEREAMQTNYLIKLAKIYSHKYK